MAGLRGREMLTESCFFVPLSVNVLAGGGGGDDAICERGFVLLLVQRLFGADVPS